MTFNKRVRVAVVGATGQFGHPLTLNLASEGADVLAISRAPSKENDQKLETLKSAERAQINYVCYVSGELANITNPETLNASELYPDYVYRMPGEMLSDQHFVFGQA